MAEAAQYSAGEVEAVVKTLYENPSGVAGANAWLTSFQNSQSAWEVSVELMRSPELNIRFFGANTLHQKIKGDYEELPAEARDNLLAAIFGFMQLPEVCAQPQILTKITLGAVALSLHFTREDGKFEKAVLGNAAFLNLPLPAALEFMLLLPQEFESTSFTTKRKDDAMAKFSAMLPHVVSLLQQPLSSSTDDAARSKCLSALAGWCAFGMSLANLRQTPLHDLIVSFLQSPHLCKPACEVFECAVSTDCYPPEPDESLLAVVTLVVALRPLYHQAAHSGNDDYCQGVCSLTRALMIRRPELLARGGGDCLALADFCLEMTGHGNRGVSESALDFWDDLQCVDMDRRHESLRAPVYARLVEVLVGCARYPAHVDDDEDEEDIDDFNLYRRRVEEGLLNCACSLRGHSLTLLCELLAKHAGDWRGTEAVLFSMQCVAGEILTIPAVAERNLILSNVTTLLTSYIYPGALVQHKLVHRGSLRVVEAYAKCVQQNLALVEPGLHYILPKLSEEGLSLHAAKAFAGVCTKGQEHLRKDGIMCTVVRAVTGLYGTIKREPMEACVQALGRVLSSLEAPAMMVELERLISPFVERLHSLSEGARTTFVSAAVLVEVAYLVSLLGSAIRFLEPRDVPAGQHHPVAVAVGNAWPVLEAVCGKFGGDPSIVDAVQGLFVKSLRQAKADASPLLQGILAAAVASYRQTRCASCLECAGVAAEVFGGQQGAAGTFGGLLGELGHVTFEAVQQAGVDAHPEIIAAFFDMAYRYLLFCPDAILPHPSFPASLDLALACLPLKEKEPLRAVLVFLDRVSQAPSPHWEQCAAAWFAQKGPQLFQGVIFALSDTCPPEALPRLSPLLFHLSARVGPQAEQWCGAALGSPQYPVPPSVLDDGAKNNFLQAMRNLGGTQRRFQAMVVDFANVCRRQNTADALLAYQM